MNDVAERAGSVAVYEALADRLRQSILGGDYKPGEMIGSEYGLSRSEGISRMTVRRASEVLLNEGLVERRPGKGLYVRASSSAVRTVQLVASNLQWDSAMLITRGAQQAGRADRIQLQLTDAHGELDLDLIRNLPETGVSGAIFLGVHSEAFNEALCELKIKGFPFVLVDQRLHEIGVTSVTADNEGGGRLVGELLVRAGHRRIAFIGDLVATTVRERLEGLRNAMADAGLAFDRTRVMDLDVAHEHLTDWSDRVEACAIELMQREDRPTALFCSCDAFARAAYRTLGKLELRIPHDVSVVGFDDDPLSEFLTPSLTTVRQPFHAMGQAATELLVRLMSDPKAPKEQRTVPVTLVTRQSVAEAARAESVAVGVG